MKNPRWHFCNVYRTAPDGRQVWQFSAGRDRVSAGASETLPIDRKPSPKLVGRDWRWLFQPRLNIAWLPDRLVFLRALTLPACEPGELKDLVEFQLEKISPVPPTQVVWTAESLGSPDGKEQTVIVAIVVRSAVESFLDNLEEQGFVPDRLEVPMLRALRAQPPVSDGLWICLEAEPDRLLSLTAWWSGGRLREIGLAQLPATGDVASILVQQLSETAWAGEMAGWWGGGAPVRIVGPAGVAARIEPAVRGWTDQQVDVVTPDGLARVAELTAVEALKGVPLVPLIPPEITARHRQRWVDQLWIQALSTVGVVYLAATIAFMVALNVRKWQMDEAESAAFQLGKTYTNTLVLKQQVGILQEQVNLKFAALDSWRSVVENLPADLTLTGFTFDRGRTLSVEGTAPAGAGEQVTAFNSSLKKVTVNGQPLFALVEPAQMTVRGADSSWRFRAELKRTESQ